MTRSLAFAANGDVAAGSDDAEGASGRDRRRRYGRGIRSPFPGAVLGLHAELGGVTGDEAGEEVIHGLLDGGKILGVNAVEPGLREGFEFVGPEAEDGGPAVIDEQFAGGDVAVPESELSGGEGDFEALLVFPEEGGVILGAVFEVTVELGEFEFGLMARGQVGGRWRIGNRGRSPGGGTRGGQRGGVVGFVHGEFADLFEGGVVDALAVAEEVILGPRSTKSVIL